MKIVILLLAMLLGFGATVRKSVDDAKEISIKHELSKYKHLPNMLPEVEIVAPSL